MAKANFYLKSTINRDGSFLILLFFSYDGERLRYSTGQSIEEKFWNRDGQKARKNYPGQTTLNDYLKSLDNAVHDIYRNALIGGNNPTKKFLADQLDLFLNVNKPKIEPEEIKQKSLMECFEEFYELSKLTNKENTAKKYLTLKNHLLKFQKQMNFKLTFDAMKKIDFYEKFQIDTITPLYKAIGFHWSRKSHATLSLQKGMRPEVVMAQGGWKDQKSFKKYVAISKSMIEEEMQKAWSKPKSKLKKVI